MIWLKVDPYPTPLLTGSSSQMSSTILEHIRVTRKFTLLGDQKTVRWVSLSKYIYFDASKQTHL